MSWAQITFSRFAISVWQQRGSVLRASGSAAPRPATGTPRQPPTHHHPSSPGGWCLAPRAAAQHQGAETPWGAEKSGKLLPNTTSSKNTCPASSSTTQEGSHLLPARAVEPHAAPSPAGQAPAGSLRPRRSLLRHHNR